jgi:pyrroloquinoline quinone biosynthesis protein D
MIDPARPLRLARKARLRFDARSGRHLLLYPERGLELDESAARVAALLGQGLSAKALVDRLAAAHPAEPRARIEADVMAFLCALDERGLLAHEEAGL